MSELISGEKQDKKRFSLSMINKYGEKVGPLARLIKEKNRRFLSLYIMLIPATILMMIFNYIPMVGVVMAFQKFNPIKGFINSPFVGWDNFIYVFRLPDTFQVIRNTVTISAMKIIAGIIVPVTFALLLNEVRSKHYKKGVQTIIYLPHFLSWVILAGILKDVLSPSEGILNALITSAGGESIFFLAEPKLFPIVILISHIWKEFGYGTIIYLAALTSIDSTLYEAAEIDGANRWQQTIYVTLPGIAPIIVLMSVLSLGMVLNAGFDQIFNLYNPVVYETGDIIDTLVYRIGLQQAQFSVATAVGLFKSVISFVFIGISYWMADRFANYRVF